MVFAAVICCLVSCKRDGDYGPHENGNVPDGGGSGQEADTSGAFSIDELKSFDVSADESPLAESEAVPSSSSDERYDDYVENSSFGSEISIVYEGTSVSVTGSVSGVTVTATQAGVTVKSTARGVLYRVSGSTGNGYLKVYSDYKFALRMEGVSITNPSGAAVNIQSGKRGFVILADGTENTLTDGTSYTSVTDGEDMKATLFSEGKLLFSGGGSLKVYANCKAGIGSDDYLLFRPGVNVHVFATAGNCIKANDAIYVKGGVINAETEAAAGKALSSDGVFVMDGGRVTAITTGGGVLDDGGSDVSGSACVKADSAFTLNGGSLLCKSTGAGGKGVSGDRTVTVNGGTLSVITTGGQYTYGRLSASPKGVKSDGAMYLNGGSVRVRCTGGEGSEGIESKSTLQIAGGTVQSYCYDDAINSAGTLTISGGQVFALGTNNDAIDSNSDIRISGGVTLAFGTTVPEAGFDCDEHTFAITGGTLIGMGGTTSTPTASACTQLSVILSGSSVSSGDYITVADAEGTNRVAFQVPMSYDRQGYTLLFSAPWLTKGDSYTFASGAEVSAESDFCGYATDAEVSGGTTVSAITLSGVVTSAAGSGNNQPGGNQPGGRPGGR